MALQRWGDVDMPGLILEMRLWSAESVLEQRAAAAALCEPRLLVQVEFTRAVLEILDGITLSIGEMEKRKNNDFRTLRKTLAYHWSVAAAALPEAGNPLMEKWLVSPDQDIRWIMKDNLSKVRLVWMVLTGLQSGC
jgi:hypothetical protein